MSEQKTHNKKKTATLDGVTCHVVTLSAPEELWSKFKRLMKIEGITTRKEAFKELMRKAIKEGTIIGY